MQSPEPSRLEGAHCLEWLVTGFKSECFLYFVCDELSVFGQISIGLDSLTSLRANQLYNFDAVVDSVAAASDIQCTAEDAVFHTGCTSLHGLTRVAKLAINAQRGEQGPAAGLAVELGQPAGLDCMPAIYLASHTASPHTAAVALTTLLREIHQKLFNYIANLKYTYIYIHLNCCLRHQADTFFMLSRLNLPFIPFTVWSLPLLPLKRKQLSTLSYSSLFTSARIWESK